jgi:transcription termination factor Rho
MQSSGAVLTQGRDPLDAIKPKRFYGAAQVALGGEIIASFEFAHSQGGQGLRTEW